MYLGRMALLISVLVLGGCTEQEQPAPLGVTYVANDGFLIECADKKTLIDALFDNFESDWCFVPPDSVVDLMVRAQSPFDDIDIIAVTHAHVDHFNAKSVIDHLRHNRSGILVCPPEVAQALAGSAYYEEIRDRIRAVCPPPDSAVTMTIAGVTIKARRTAHGPYYEEDQSTGVSVDRHRNVQHLEYLFSVAGRVVYHSGDAGMHDLLKYTAYGYGADSIDLAFVQWWSAGEMLTFRQKLVRDVIHPERVILMHLSPGRKPGGHPEQQPVAKEVIVPQYPMQGWVFRARPGAAEGE